jgi:hypothetical protein
MGAYSDDALRQLVDLRERGGELTADQKRALVSWLQTDDNLREELQRELEEAGYDPRPEPLSAGHEADLRARGLLERRSLRERLSGIFRKRIGKRSRDA